MVLHDPVIREAESGDFDFVVNLMETYLAPYYGGDHRAHAERIFTTHLSGGKDKIGHFSTEQKMFIITLAGEPVGMLHLVGKRQGNYKISPIIISAEYRVQYGLGSKLLDYAEQYAKKHNARQIYCTVSEQNYSALQFFKKHGYTVAGRSESQYKVGYTEIMMYKYFTTEEYESSFDRPHISVMPFEEYHELEVRRLLLDNLPEYFKGIDNHWVDALFEGYYRRHSEDINKKFKLLFVAMDRSGTILGVAGATPKKGAPIKVMPFIAVNLPAFVALLTDIPYELRKYGRKLYLHICPNVEQTIALQERGWQLDAAMPAGYHEKHVTQQWSYNIEGDSFMRIMRVKKEFIEQIRAGKKTLEIRVGYPTIKTIKPGERINMSSRTQEQTVRVLDRREYKNHEEMLQKEDYRKIAPHMHSKEELLKLLNEIYPPEKQELGIIVFEIEKASNQGVQSDGHSVL